jgi:hypothetical protein
MRYKFDLIAQLFFTFVIEFDGIYFQTLNFKIK